MLDIPNLRMGENALKIQDIERQVPGADDNWDGDEFAPVDGNFEAAVHNWYHNSNSPTLSTSKYSGRLPNTPLHHDQREFPQTDTTALESPTTGMTHFTPNTTTLGGPAKQLSPMRPGRAQRSYKLALLSPPPSVEISGNPPTSPTLFRRKHGKHQKPGSLASKPVAMTTHLAIATVTAAPVDDEIAQQIEDYQCQQNDFNSWDDPWYMLRMEEANLLSDMFMQLSRTLGLGSVVFTDQGNNLQHFVQQVNWSTVTSRQDVLVYCIYAIDSLPDLGSQRFKADQLDCYSNFVSLVVTPTSNQPVSAIHF